MDKNAFGSCSRAEQVVVKGRGRGERPPELGAGGQILLSFDLPSTLDATLNPTLNSDNVQLAQPPPKTVSLLPPIPLEAPRISVDAQEP